MTASADGAAPPNESGALEDAAYREAVIDLLGAIYFGLIAWFGGQQAVYAWRTGQRSASELAVCGPYWLRMS